MSGKANDFILDNVLSETTKELQIYLSIPFDDNLTQSEFEKEILPYIRIQIETSYISNDEDIEDLGDKISLLIMIIKKNIISTDTYEKFHGLFEMCILTKKLAKAKYREGLDFINNTNVKIRTYENPNDVRHNAIPRSYWNIEEIDYQYYCLQEYIWKGKYVKMIEELNW